MPSLKVAITGSHGLVGSALVARLADAGHHVLPIPRDSWNGSGFHLRSVDAVVHLAGESIASGIWTPARKQRILQSRIESTGRITEVCARDGIATLVCASATGFYGHREDEELTEESRAGLGFLAEVCQQWEAASHANPSDSLRVVNLRFGQILSELGGALSVQQRLYRFGFGARLGSGRQWMPWIALDDAINAILLALAGSLSGPVNVVSPTPYRQSQMHELLCRKLNRPRFPVVPELLLQLLPGGFGRELLLASARVIPQRLAESGFVWERPDLTSALGMRN
jgi:uncharacterized protein